MSEKSLREKHEEARQQWPEAYKGSPCYKRTVGKQHVGACPVCGGDDRFWIQHDGDLRGAFGSRKCEGNTSTCTKDIAGVLDQYTGVDLTPPKKSKGKPWKSYREHVYRTSKGNVKHWKGLPPDAAEGDKPMTRWKHWNEKTQRWNAGMGPDVTLDDLLWNHWAVKPEHEICIVCEGEKDATNLYTALRTACPNVVVVSGGGGAGTARLNLEPVSHINTFYVLFDADEAGRQGCVTYARKIKQTFPDAHVFYHAPEGEGKEDWSDVMERIAAEHPGVEREVIDARTAVLTEMVKGQMEQAELMTVDKSQADTSPPEHTVLDVSDPDEWGLPCEGKDSAIAKWILVDVLGRAVEEEYYGAPVIFDRTRDDWFFCRGGVWKQIDFPQVAVGLIDQMCGRLVARGDQASADLARQLGSHRKCQSIVSKIQQYTRRWGTKLFDQNDSLVCGRGPDFGEKEILMDPCGKQVSHNAQVWDVETGTIRDAQFDDYIRTTLQVDLPTLPPCVNTASDANEWLNLLWEKAPNFYSLIWQMSHYRVEEETDKGLSTSAIHEDLGWIAHLCEWMGACLVAGNQEEKFLFFTGEGGNGKGVVSEIIAKKIGGRNLVHIAPRGLLSRRNNAHRQEQAVLEGVRCLIVDEPRGTDPDLLKQWSGGQEITADHKSGPSVTFGVKFLMMLLSNDMPRFPRADPALQRRLIGIPFDMQFRNEGGDFPRKMKPEIFAEIEDELPNVTWILLSMYRATRLRKSFTECARVRKASKELLLSTNRVIEFIEECLTVEAMSPGITSGNLWTLYKEWMNSRHYRGALPRRSFTAEVRNIIGRVDDYASVTYSNNVYDMAGKRGRGFLGFSVVKSRIPSHDSQAHD